MRDLLGRLLNGPPPPNLLLYFERQREAGPRRERAGDRRSDRRTLADLIDGVSALPPLHRRESVAERQGRQRTFHYRGAERINRRDFYPQSDVWVEVLSTCQWKTLAFFTTARLKTLMPTNAGRVESPFFLDNNYNVTQVKMI